MNFDSKAQPRQLLPSSLVLLNIRTLNQKRSLDNISFPSLHLWCLIHGLVLTQKHSLNSLPKPRLCSSVHGHSLHNLLTISPSLACAAQYMDTAYPISPSLACAAQYMDTAYTISPSIACAAPYMDTAYTISPQSPKASLVQLNTWTQLT